MRSRFIAFSFHNEYGSLEQENRVILHAGIEDQNTRLPLPILDEDAVAIRQSDVDAARADGQHDLDRQYLNYHSDRQHRVVEAILKRHLVNRHALPPSGLSRKPPA